jgi:glycosyltransferase involved in cell wall biosynthesis
VLRIYLFGDFQSYWSRGGVSRGLLNAFKKRGYDVTPVDFYPGGKVQKNLYEKDAIAFYACGYPPQIYDWAQQVPCRLKGALVIVESERVPREWLLDLKGLDVIATPSSWAVRILEGRQSLHSYQTHFRVGQPLGKENFLKRENQVVLAAHGVDEEFYSRARPRSMWCGPAAVNDCFTWEFLHIAGTVGFDRKGTDILCAAWADFVKEVCTEQVKATLTIRCPELSTSTLEIIHANGDAFDIDREEDTGPKPPWEMAEYMRTFNGVIQPSRAECYGLVPCEARVLGIPVIMTDSTGHREHYETNDVLIHCGATKETAVQGLTNGACPSISKDSILDALRYFWAHRHVLTVQAQSLAQDPHFQKRNDWYRNSLRLFEKLEHTWDKRNETKSDAVVVHGPWGQRVFEQSGMGESSEDCDRSECTDISKL